MHAPLGLGDDAELPQRRIAVEDVSLEAGGFGDLVLQEAMDEVDVRTDEFVVRIELLDDECPEVDEELEIERADVADALQDRSYCAP